MSATITSVNINTMEFQTRNQAGYLKFFSSFGEAFAEYLRDPTVWKISFKYNNTHYRWVCKRYYEIADEAQEEKFKSILNIYKNTFLDRDESAFKNQFTRPADWATNKNVFWINMSVISPNYSAIMSDVTSTDEEKDLKADLDRILEVLPQEDFVTRFRDLK